MSKEIEACESFHGINPIERSLLLDLLGLYTCDLKRDKHFTRSC